MNDYNILTFWCRLKELGYGDLGITLIPKPWGRLNPGLLTIRFRFASLIGYRPHFVRLLAKKRATKSEINFQVGGFLFFYFSAT